MVRSFLRTTVVGVTLDAGADGRVVITAMSADGAGYAAGLRVDDVLLSVQGEACVLPDQASGLLRAAEGAVAVRLERRALGPLHEESSQKARMGR